MREETDCIEREVKFVPPGSEEDVLALVRSRLRPDWVLAKNLPLAAHDLYLDTPSLDLYRRDTTFRFRRRKRAKGWTANFKDRGAVEGKFLERREVRTSVSAEEALGYRTGRVPGLAGSLASQSLTPLPGQAPPPLSPTVYAVSYRRRYKVWPRGYDFTDATPELEIVFITFDEVEGFDVRAADTDSLLRSGLLAYPKPLPSVRFEVGELEVHGQALSLGAEAAEMVREVADVLQQQGVRLLRKSKYRESVERLGMVPNRL